MTAKRAINTNRIKRWPNPSSWGAGLSLGGGGCQWQTRDTPLGYLYTHTPPKIQQQQQDQLLNMISMKLPHTKQSQAGFEGELETLKHNWDGRALVEKSNLILILKYY